MKKILIISDGVTGDHFIERVIDTYTSENIYYIIQPRATEFENATPARFKFFEFDPTSLYKLSNILKMEFVQVIVVMKNPLDVENTIKNIRTCKKQLRIVVLDQWNMEIADKNVALINANDLLASRLIDYLPNVPVIAQNVGIGEGEIMEVLVPFGSSFVYRHIGVIEQKSWRIVGIYRDRKLIMPTRRRMIHPNDQLLLIGEPSVLNSVYRAIKRELGQFPVPFGSSLYLFIDMDKDDKNEILSLLNRAVFVHRQFKHDLFVKVCNPNDIDLLRKIKAYRSDQVHIEIDYLQSYIDDVILGDIKNYHIGLVMVSRRLFAKSEMRQILFEGNVPVLKLADRPIADLKEVAVLLADNKDLEKISTTVFDISAQLGFNLEVYKYRNDASEMQEQIMEHYQNLSSIFSKNIKIIEHDLNPIRLMRKKENFLQCLPFTEKMLPKPIFSLFSTDSEKLYYRLDNFHQIFIPVKI
jgi:hypothetical protein